jgi:hypothetical protein
VHYFYFIFFFERKERRRCGGIKGGPLIKDRNTVGVYRERTIRKRGEVKNVTRHEMAFRPRERDKKKNRTSREKDCLLFSLLDSLISGMEETK